MSFKLIPGERVNRNEMMVGDKVLEPSNSIRMSVFLDQPKVHSIKKV
jgi:hypothetical protein